MSLLRHMDGHFLVTELYISIISQRYSKHPQTKYLECPTCNNPRFSTEEVEGGEGREQTQGHLATMQTVNLKTYKHPLHEKTHSFHTVA